MSIHEQPNPNNWYFPEDSSNDSVWLPSNFAEVVARVNNFTVEEFDRQVVQNQLYYHNREHLINVQRRAIAIFEVICPYWQASLGQSVTSDDISRMYLLLDLCAVAHDMIQIFIPQTQPHTSRRREPGVSENLTIEKLLAYINGLNQHLKKHCLEDSVLFTDTEISMIQDAIHATICLYDPSDQGIYQPDLYDESKDLSLVARIIAIADIGSLGIDGINTFNQEGSLIFLEENPDIIALILNQKIATLAVDNPELYENMRQRLLRRARFQVNFAKSRLMRYHQEVASFPKAAIPTLTSETFQYLTLKTIQDVESNTPTNEETTLEELIIFFNLEYFLNQS